MIRLTFIVCAITGYGVCKPVELAAPSLFACQSQGQMQMAIWQNNHPNYEIKGGYRCVKGVEA